MQRVALITGCSSGIGRATAEALLAEEWDVMATARHEAALTDLREAGCRTAALDVTADEEVAAVVDEVFSTWNRLDCLVNNAGYAQLGPIEDVPVERVHRQFDVNVYGPHRLTRAVLPHMRERGDGTIINVSSSVGRLAVPGAGAYSGSKFALEAMSDALRAEVSPFGVDVVLIEPGNVNTSFADRATDEASALSQSGAYDALYELMDDWAAIGGFDLGHLAPEDVADTIVNAASATQPDARYVLGTTGHVARIGALLPARVRDAVYRVLVRATSIRGDR